MARYTSSMPLFDRPAPAEINSTVPEADKPRVQRISKKLYKYMQDGEWHTGPELAANVCMSFGQRLHEFKRAGIPFDTEHIGKGVHRYRLIGSPTNGVGS